ncbi:MAG: hypothetical protein R3F42_12455 [Pseudomonadota bacterium]
MALLRIAFILALVNLAGCSFVATYNPDFGGEPPAVDAPLTGKALIYTTREETGYTFSGNPTSFTGGGTNLSIELGEITYRLAVKAFGSIFTQGAEHAESLDDAGSYTIVVKPRVTKYSYAYNQLKNIGFAITPQVDLDVEVRVLDAAGNSVLDKTYSSGIRDGKSYMMSGAPGEKISAVTHQTIAELLNQAAQETYTALRASRAAGLQ